MAIRRSCQFVLAPESLWAWVCSVLDPQDSINELIGPLGTNQRVCFIDFLDEVGPALLKDIFYNAQGWLDSRILFMVDGRETRRPGWSRDRAHRERGDSDSVGPPDDGGLSRNPFRCSADRGLAGMLTAFVARWGKGRPRIVLTAPTGRWCQPNRCPGSDFRPPA